MNRLKTKTLPLTILQLEQRLKQIVKHIKEIDLACQELLAQDQILSQRFEILSSIPGFGKVTALILLVDMPELGTVESKQASALAGCAPTTRQSGLWQGRAFVQGGRKQVRDALYMPAMVSCRYNPYMQKKYDQLLENEKS